MDPSNGRLNTSNSNSQHPMYSYNNSISNLVSNDEKYEELNSGWFDFDDSIESSNQFLAPFASSSFISAYPNQFLDSPSLLFNSNVKFLLTKILTLVFKKFFLCDRFTDILCFCMLQIVSTPTTGSYFGYDIEEGKTNVSGLIPQSRTSPATIFRNKMVCNFISFENFMNLDFDLVLSCWSRGSHFESNLSISSDRDMACLHLTLPRPVARNGIILGMVWYLVLSMHIDKLTFWSNVLVLSFDF